MAKNKKRETVFTPSQSSPSEESWEEDVKAGEAKITKTTKKTAGSNRLVSSLIIFVAGFLAGVGFTVYRGGGQPPATIVQAGSQQAMQQAEQTSGQSAGISAEMIKAISSMEAEVTKDPKNFLAWTRLGHLYFDSNQPRKAIEAYTKSLALHEGDANLLTDLGIMYRRADQPEKAIESFEKAMQLDGSHIQSRLNKGIVLMYDLNDQDGAIASWEDALRINPEATTTNGRPLADYIAELKQHSKQQ